MGKRIIVLINQASYMLEGRLALGWRRQQKLKDPPGLIDKAKVRKITGLAFFVGRREDSQEGWLPVEAHAPAIAFTFVGNVRGPGLRVELPEAFQELPEERMVIFNGALLVRVGGKNDERGVQAIFVGGGDVG